MNKGTRVRMLDVEKTQKDMRGVLGTIEFAATGVDDAMSKDPDPPGDFLPHEIFTALIKEAYRDNGYDADTMTVYGVRLDTHTDVVTWVTDDVVEVVE